MTMETNETDTWFLLVQYRRRGKTAVTEFTELSEAADAYGEAERKHKNKMKGSDPEIDVLLVGASSLEVVKERYPSYFATGKSRSDRMHNLLAALPSVPAH
jgi:hypothetical protein